MNRICVATAIVAVWISALSCSKETKSKERSYAKDMYEQICKLTKDYTDKVTESNDSASWALACSEFEDKLDKVNFSYPPDTDLLLTEGQNDTIYSLMLAYSEARDRRIHRILHPVVEVDTLTSVDSTVLDETTGEVSASDASRNHGN